MKFKNVLIGLMLTLTGANASPSSGQTPVDLSKVREETSRELIEPVYQNGPKYTLLVFGPEAEKAIWVVLDGNENIYADMNGDGDITDEGEKFDLVKGRTNPEGRTLYFNRAKLGEVPPYSIAFTILVRNPDYIATDIEIRKSIDEVKKNNWTMGLVTRRPGRDGMTGFTSLIFVPNQVDAQVTWMGGPLSLVTDEDRFSKESVLRRDKKDSLTVSVGTVGLPATNSDEMVITPLTQNELPEAKHPIATLRFAATEIQVALDSRTNSARSHGVIDIPNAETGNSVEVEFSYPDFDGDQIKSIKRTYKILPAAQ